MVSNPPPSFGGRYFVFLKLTTTCGIEGVGEVYAATFGPHAIASMIEDVFMRRFEGRDPFQIESIWRESYGSGFSLRPDLSLMGVVSGLEMACWDIIGKAVEQPVYNLLGGKVHERLRSYTYLYPAEGEGDEFYHDAERSAERAAEYRGTGVHRSQIRSLWGVGRHTIRVNPARKRWSARSASHVWSARPWVKGRICSSAPMVNSRHPVRHPPGQALGTLRSSLVRGAGAAGNARTNGHRRARHQHPHRHRRTTDHQVRIRPRVERRRRPHFAAQLGSRRRPPGGEKSRRLG